MTETPDIRWFQIHARCFVCGKTSVGILRGKQNESYGSHCQACANIRLEASKKARAAEALASRSVPS